ncbi:hypothetical protein [Ktedonobacter robiniae]|uniref:Uncharacterized protein n=1 Tax=Ktedonobacter robiniae TaxID=2778365 RepID=A0ABQ3UG50_9CHLR|nr:hypothetical protein [Ktedonobacter robiniae]GHO51697.1 hypothetical protein KSB_01720 [Ktedonobacter robiniae]
MRVQATFKDFVSTEYSSAFLLSTRLDTWIVGDSEFQKVCEWGFDGYFESMYCESEDPAQLVLAEQSYSEAEVVQLVVDVVLPDHMESVASRAGYALGWLSALALIDRQTSLIGLSVWESLLISSSLVV